MVWIVFDGNKVFILLAQILRGKRSSSWRVSLATMSDPESSPWLEAHSDPVAGVNTLSCCMDLADLSGDGENCLVLADIGSTGTTGAASTGMKLKVFRGTSLVSESSLLDLPSGLVAFFMDLNEPRVPALAVASGPCVYVYKNLRPYFKFTLPGLELDPLEQVCPRTKPGLD